MLCEKLLSTCEQVAGAEASLLVPPRLVQSRRLKCSTWDARRTQEVPVGDVVRTLELHRFGLHRPVIRQCVPFCNRATASVQLFRPANNARRKHRTHQTESLSLSLKQKPSYTYTYECTSEEFNYYCN